MKKKKTSQKSSVGVVKGMKNNQFPVLCSGQQKSCLNSLCLNEFYSILQSVWNPGGSQHHFVRIDHSWPLKLIYLYLVTQYVFVVLYLSVMVEIWTLEEIQEFIGLSKFTEHVCSNLERPSARAG